MSRYALEHAPIPHELSRALTLKAWGAGDVYRLPAGMIRKMNVALNTYNTLQAYLRAGRASKVTQFAKENPDGWDLVTRILKAQKEGWKSGDSSK